MGGAEGEREDRKRTCSDVWEGVGTGVEGQMCGVIVVLALWKVWLWWL